MNRKTCCRFCLSAFPPGDVRRNIKKTTVCFLGASGTERRRCHLSDDFKATSSADGCKERPLRPWPKSIHPPQIVAPATGPCWTQCCQIGQISRPIWQHWLQLAELGNAVTGLRTPGASTKALLNATFAWYFFPPRLNNEWVSILVRLVLVLV